jgi:hypothetical protein
MLYQNIHFIFISILVTTFSLIGLVGKTKSSLSSVLLLLLQLGSGFVILGLGVSLWVSRAPIYDLATFKEYHFTFQFIKLYLFGLSFLLTIPVLVLGNFFIKIFGYANK